MNVVDLDCVVIGGGQAGLSAGYFLQRFGVESFEILDHAPRPGGAWQFRWPSLTLAGANHVHDLPGWGLVEALGVDCDRYPARTAVADYFGRYEQKFQLPVRRPVDVRVVSRVSGGFAVTGATPDGPLEITARQVISATGTWDRPFVPFVRGIGTFRGRQLHTHDYRDAAEFTGQRVLVVGAGISALQLLVEIAHAGAQTFWVSRREPEFRTTSFSPEDGRAAVARVEERVRAGLPPGSVVSVTGLPLTPALEQARAEGILVWRPMFDEITASGVRWRDGAAEATDLAVDVIFWNTGFRAALDHLAPLRIRNTGGGITMTGRLATEIAGQPGLQLLGYGPSASTIGANRAGREAARVVAAALRDEH